MSSPGSTNRPAGTQPVPWEQHCTQTRDKEMEREPMNEGEMLSPLGRETPPSVSFDNETEMPVAPRLSRHTKNRESAAARVWETWAQNPHPWTGSARWPRFDPEMDFYCCLVIGWWTLVYIPGSNLAASDRTSELDTQRLQWFHNDKKKVSFLLVLLDWVWCVSMYRCVFNRCSC